MCKKFLLVVPDTDLGGVTTAAYNLANVLCEKGHSVDFLDMSGSYQNSDVIDSRISHLFLKGKSRYWRITSKNKCGLGSLPHKLLGAVKKTTIKSGRWYRTIFSDFAPDITYDAVFAFRQCAPCYSFVLHKVKAKKKIGFVHGEKKYMGDISSWDKYFKDFDHIACVSDYVRGEFAEAYPDMADKFGCVYNTFDIEGIKAWAKEISSTVFDKSKINIVTVGRIDNAFKRLHFVPQICRILRDRGVGDFVWYVIGDGQDLSADRRLTEQLGVADLAMFVGRRDNPFPYVKAADLFVMCSLSEAYAMTVKESHALGVPVLSADYATAYEAIEDGVDGYIVEGTPEALADKIEWLLADGGRELMNIQNSAREKQVTNELAYSQLMQIVNE